METDGNDMERFPASPDVPFEEDDAVISEAIDLLNQGLNLLGVSPIQKKKYPNGDIQMKK